MVDISMCSGEGCPRKNECYRHRAKDAGEYQSWFARPPLESDLNCDEFLEIWPERRKRLREPT